MIMKKLLVLSFAVLFSLSLQAQKKSNEGVSYQNALGVKVFDGGGVTFKHFFNEKNAGELVGYFWRNGTRITGLYEIHNNISGVDGLKWYIGPGAHVGIYKTGYGDGTYFGVDGVLGLDYKFKSAPINLSADWQPSYEFGDNRGFYGNWGGLAIRFTF